MPALAAIFAAVALVLNLMDGGHSYPEDRPALAEPCWFEDDSAFWIQVGGTTEVCGDSGHRWVYMEVDNGD